MRTGLRLSSVVFFAAIGVPQIAARADEEKALRPEIEQMVQSLTERVEAAADKLGLSAEQRTKIREIQASRADQRKAMRAERRALLQDELKSISEILTPAQREKVKDLAEDKLETAKTAPRKGLPNFVAERSTLAERVEADGNKLGLTDDQRKQIIATLSTHAERHATLRAKCRDACDDESKAIAAVLTPEQKKKFLEDAEQRVVRAVAAKSVSDRIASSGSELGLTADQRQQIAKSHPEYAAKYRELRSDRRDLLRDELKAISAFLTPEQRDMVKDFSEDQVVIFEGSATDRDRAEAMNALKETVSERLEAVGDKLQLTAEQKGKIRDVRTSFADRFKSQRDQRNALRQQELKAISGILTADQRDKVKDYVDERSQVL